MALTKEEILAAIESRKSELTTFEVPEWGGTVYIRRMSSEEAARLDGDEGRMPARTIAACVTDENGERLFTDADVRALAAADMGAITDLFVACLQHNGMTSDKLDEAVANFKDAQPDSSSSS